MAAVRSPLMSTSFINYGKISYGFLCATLLKKKKVVRRHECLSSFTSKLPDNLDYMNVLDYFYFISLHAACVGVHWIFNANI